jgi:ABC-2 type transport system permease protein
VVDAAALQRSAASAAATFGKAAQGAGLAPLVERKPLARAGDQKAAPGVAGQVLAGMMIFFMMFGALNVARGILEEDEEGTLRRLFTTPTPLREILGGKFLSIFLTVLVQIALLLVAGRLIFGTRWGGPAQVVLLTLDGAAVGAGLAVLLISLARTSRQAGSVSSGVVLVLALLGGNFVGSVSDTGVFSVIQRLTPNGWLLRAWITTLNGGSLSDIVLALLLVAAFALVTFSLGLLRFRHRYA